MTRRQTLFAALLMAITLQTALPVRAQAVSDTPLAGVSCQVTAPGLDSACDAVGAVEATDGSPEPDPTVLLLAAAAVIALRLVRARRPDAA